MIDIAPNTPPFAPTPTDDQQIHSWADRHPALLVAASIGIGLTAAAVVGTSIGLLVYYGFAADCHNDGWCEMGAAIFGVLAGCLAGGVAHIVAGVAFIRRHRPRGRRAVSIVLHIGLPIMLYAVLGALSNL